MHATGVSFGALLLPSAGWPSLAQRAREVEAAELSRGRLDVGLGSGYAPSDHAALGEKPWSAGERMRRFAGAVPAVRAALGEVRLSVAAHGRRAIELAGRHGDAWVSFGGFGLEPHACLELTRRRIGRLEAAADGRTVRRRLLCGSAALTREPIWRSVDAFEDFVGRYRSIGIDEFAFHWPPRDTNLKVDDAVVDEILTRLPGAR